MTGYTRAVELLAAWYRGGGWYSDGDGRAFDHYNGWALHFYPVLDAHLAGAPTEHGARLREFLAGFAATFGADGAPIHFGRSLTYRFAAAASVALGAVTGHTPLAPGVSRRLLNRSLRYFLDRGAVGQDGLLTLGWHGPHVPTLQPYSGPASPYWAAKAFAGLLAPPGHPLWTDDELPLPSEGPDRVRALPVPGLLVQATQADGIVRLHNHGSDDLRPHEAERAEDDDPRYGRFAYSTRTGPTAAGNIADNHVAVVVDGVRGVRRRIHPLGAEDGDGRGWAASWHTPVFAPGPPIVPGLRVETVVVVRGRYELRVHRVVGAPAGARVELTGWATGPGDSAWSALHPVCGWTGQDEVRAPAGTAFTRWAVVPRLTGEARGTAVYAAVAVLAERPCGLSAVLTDIKEDADRITVRWTDDDSTTDIAFNPFAVRFH